MKLTDSEKTGLTGLALFMAGALTTAWLLAGWSGVWIGLAMLVAAAGIVIMRKA